MVCLLVVRVICGYWESLCNAIGRDSIARPGCVLLGRFDDRAHGIFLEWCLSLCRKLCAMLFRGIVLRGVWVRKSDAVQFRILRLPSPCRT